jgi:TPR repeat protein
LLADDFNPATLQTAADKGDVKAQYELAHRYAHGDGVANDPAKAFEYMRKAAEEGYALAQTDLGTYYSRGIGVETNTVAAAEWYRKSATQGDLLGEYCLGACFLMGSGVATNESEGIKWWVDAGEKGQVDAQAGLGLLFMDRGVVNDPGLIDYTEAASWLLMAANQDNAPSMNGLAYLYQNGMGVALNYKEAVKWYRNAADRDNARAQANLGMMYEHGMGVSTDPVEAFKWYILSFDKGDMVGRYKYQEFNFHHTLQQDQIAKAQKMAAEFRTTHHLPPIPEISTNSANTNLLAK